MFDTSSNGPESIVSDDPSITVVDKSSTASKKLLMQMSVDSTFIKLL